MFSVPHNVFGAAFSPDSGRLVTFGPERLVRLWDIRRQQELEALVEAVGLQQQAEEELAVALQSCQNTLLQLEEQRHALQRELQASTRQHAELSARMSAHQARIEQIAARRERVNAEIEESRGQFAHQQAAIAEARQLLAAAIERMETDSHRREELLSVRDQTRSTLDSARQKARHDKDLSHRTAMRCPILPWRCWEDPRGRCTGG